MVWVEWLNITASKVPSWRRKAQTGRSGSNGSVGRTASFVGPVQKTIPSASRSRLFRPTDDSSPSRKSIVAGDEPLRGGDGGLDGLVADLLGERLLALVAVDRHRRRRVMGVRGVDQDVVERDARLASIRLAARSRTSRLTISTSHSTRPTLPPCGSSITIAEARSFPSWPTTLCGPIPPPMTRSSLASRSFRSRPRPQLAGAVPDPPVSEQERAAPRFHPHSLRGVPDESAASAIDGGG